MSRVTELARSRVKMLTVAAGVAADRAGIYVDRESVLIGAF